MTPAFPDLRAETLSPVENRLAPSGMMCTMGLDGAARIVVI